MDGIVNYYEENGRDLNVLAEALAKAEAFQAQFADKTVEEKAEAMLERFGLEKGTVAGENAYEFFKLNLEAGSPEWQILKAAADYLESPDMDPMFADAKTVFDNKVTVAEFSVEKDYNETDIAKLQDVLDDVDNSLESVEAAEEKIIEAVANKVDLQAGVEAIVGTAGDDIFMGVVSSLSSEKTLDPDDKIDGGDGEDTLDVTLKSSFTGFTGEVKNVENIELTNDSTIARTFSAKGITGAENYTLNADKAAISELTDLEKAVDIRINEQAKGSFTSTFASAAKEVTGTADKMALMVNNVGTAATDTVDEEAVAITLTDIEEINLTAAGENNIIKLEGDDLNTLSIEGKGDVKLASVSNTLENVKASALLGDLTADLSGVDTLKTLETGDGADSITISTENTKADMVISGGDGEDTLTITSTNDAVAAYNLSGFETLKVGAVNGVVTFSGENVSDVNKIIVSEEATNASGKVEFYKMATSDLTFEVQDSAQGTIETDNTGAAVVDYATTKTDLQTSSATFTFLKAQDVTVNIKDNVKVTGDLEASKAKSLALNVAEKGAFSSDIKAESVTDLALTSEGGTITAEGDSNFNSLESLTVKTGNVVDLSAVALDKAHSLELTGSGADAAVKLNTVGTKATDYDVTVSAENLIAGLTATSITSNQDVKLTATGTKVGTDGSKTNLESVTGDVTVDVKSSEKIYLGNISADAGKADIDIENYDTTTVGAITAKDVVLDLSGTYDTVTLNTVTVTDSLDIKTGLKGLTSTIEIAEDATDTTINLTGNVKEDVFTINTKEYTENAELTVKGDLDNGTDTVAINASAEKSGNALTIDVSGLKNISKTTITGGVGADKITGSAVKDTVSAGDGADTISTGDGDDIIDGEAGADKIYAGAGNDKITIDGDDTVVDGGAGVDTVTLGAEADFTDEGDVFTGVEIIDMSDGGDNLTLTTAQFADVTNIKGDDGSANILTLKGTDTTDTVDVSAITFDANVKEVDIFAGKGKDTITLSDQTEKVVTQSPFENADTIKDFGSDGSGGGDLLYVDFTKNELTSNHLNADGTKIKWIKDDASAWATSEVGTIANTTTGGAATLAPLYTGSKIGVVTTADGAKKLTVGGEDKITKATAESASVKGVIAFYDTNDHKLQLIYATMKDLDDKTADGGAETKLNTIDLSIKTIANITLADGASIAANDIYIF
jgi:hypothetical protein